MVYREIDPNRRQVWRVLTGGVAAVSLGLLTQGAHAQSGTVAPPQTQGFYVGAGLGANTEESNRFRQGGANATVGYDTGFAGIMNFGYGFGNGLRLELEPGYRVNQVDRTNGGIGSGRTQMATFMGNVIYDFNYVTPVIPLQPHLGAGVGYAHLWNRSGLQSGVRVSGQDDVPAFQGIAGFDYSLNPSDKVGFDYRYLVAHDATFRVNNGLTTRAGDLDNHTFLITFRHQFGAPQAVGSAAKTTAAAPAPAPAPTQTASLPAPRPFEVYFDFDSSRLTEEGRAVVDQAAANAKQGQATQILATGHTDTVGTSTYNQALSLKRANAVRAALLSDGIAATAIKVSGVGENDLAVSTGDNINEPRNRRVEVLVQAPGT